MKRRLMKLVVFLLLGAVVNVAVAWGIVLWSNEYPYTPAYEKLGKRADWARLVARDWPPPQFQAFGQTWGLSLQIQVVRPSLSRTSPGAGLSLFRSGWPSRALEAEYQGKHFGGTPLNRTWRYSIELPQRARPNEPACYRPVPCRPVWPGFAINTVFYALILLLLIRGPFVLRRAIRRKRGQCVTCGYDLRGDLDGGCPECGWRRDPATRECYPAFTRHNATMGILDLLTLLANWGACG